MASKKKKEKVVPESIERAKIVQYSVDDLRYLRKRLTQLEKHVQVKDIRYRKLQNKFRSFMYAYTKLLRKLHVPYEEIERYYSRIPYIEAGQIEKEVEEYMRTTDFERKYYEE